MDIPARYSTIRKVLPQEVRFGCGGIRLLDHTEIESGQIGYAVASEGTSLSSRDGGRWQPDWLVIGFETACGDPLFMDTSSDALPVFTAVHGIGSWEAAPVASSIDVFASCVGEFSRIAIGRGCPVEREKNPVSDNERKTFLATIAVLNQTSSSPEFWDVLLEC